MAKRRQPDWKAQLLIQVPPSRLEGKKSLPEMRLTGRDNPDLDYLSQFSDYEDMEFHRAMEYPKFKRIMMDLYDYTAEECSDAYQEQEERLRELWMRHMVERRPWI